VSVLVRDAIDAAGFAEVLEARLRGAQLAGAMARLERADLLVLGAIADDIRAREVGDEVRIYVRDSAERTPMTELEGNREVTGSDLLRQVALKRIAAPAGAAVRVDWARCGLELAQVALWFGADELIGTLVTKRGALIAEDDLLGVGKKSRREPASQVKRRELAVWVRQFGRIPVFVGPQGGAEVEEAR